MLKLVPTVRTQSTEHDFIKALLVAWFNLTQQTPRKESIGVLHAQHCVETGANGVSCWNFNIGNLKAKNVDGKTVEYCVLKGVWEIDKNGKKVYLKETDPGSWFLSFNSLEEGATVHLDLLKNKRYKSSWPAIEKGDYALFSKLIRANGYYTAPESSYTSLLKKYFDQYMKDGVFEKVLEEFKAEQNKQEDVPMVVEVPVEPKTPDGYVTIANAAETKSFWSLIGDFFKWAFKL